MELREYLAVIWRRAWVIALVFGLTLLASLGLMFATPPSIPVSDSTATSLVAIQPIPETRSGDYYTYDGYYAYQAAELHQEDLIRILESPMFLESVKARLPELASEVDDSRIVVTKSRSVLSITVTAPSSRAALAVAESTVSALSTEGSAVDRYLSSIVPQSMRAVVVIPPGLQEATTGASRSRSLVDLGLRGVLGLLAGLALAFLIDYLDDTFRARADVERALGLPVLGEVPVGSSGARQRGGA
jgi:capsular polysaccharide biosynthesis protein